MEQSKNTKKYVAKLLIIYLQGGLHCIITRLLISRPMMSKISIWKSM